MEARESNLQDDKSRLWHLAALFIAVIGLILSLYQIYHFRLVMTLGESGSFCNINSTVNCDAVAMSSYSRFLTVPIPVWGTAFFFSICGLLLCSLNGLGNRKEHLLAYALSVLSGVIVSIILAFISFKILGLTCIACVSVYCVTLVQAILLRVAFKRRLIDLSGVTFKNLYSGLVSLALGFAIVLTTYNIIGEQDLVPKKIVKESSSEESHTSPSSSSPNSSINEIPISLNPYSGFGEDYRKGPDDSKARIIIFSDFQCPACRSVSNVLEEIYQSFPGKVQLVYRNYPLDQACNPVIQHKAHEHACKLATLARCAGVYGKFWAYHDLAFEKQADLSVQSPVIWAKKVGLTDEQIDGCLTDKAIADKLKDDIELGTKLGIEGTPTIFLNGRRMAGSLQELRDNVRSLVE